MYKAYGQDIHVSSFYSSLVARTKVSWLEILSYWQGELLLVTRLFPESDAESQFTPFTPGRIWKASVSRDRRARPIRKHESYLEMDTFLMYFIWGYPAELLGGPGVINLSGSGCIHETLGPGEKYLVCSNKINSSWELAINVMHGDLQVIQPGIYQDIRDFWHRVEAIVIFQFQHHLILRPMRS